MSNCTNNFIKRVIGVTRTFKWTITTNGAAVPLVADDLTLQLVPPRGEAVSLPFDVDDNIVSFTWQGEDQHIIGCYSLILWANFGEENQRRVDIHNFVELIPWSDRQSGEYSDLIEETIELETADFGENIMVVDNLNSTSATDALSANMGRQLNATKQDVISDLATIRSGAAAGAAVKEWAKNDPLITDDGTQVSASKLAFNGNLFEQWVPGIASSIGLKGIAGFLKLADISQWDSAYNDRMLPTVAAVKAKLQAVLTALATIEAVIPSQASSTNKLTDKDYVDGAIATNTANFVGTFDTLAELQAVPNPTKNDYGFVIEQDAQGNEYYDRYKYTGTQWLFEYKVESTPFTAEQWAAIQSGITAALVTKLSALPTNAELTTALAGKQPVINDLTTIRSGAAAGATAYQKPSGGIPKTDLASAVQTSLGKADSAYQKPSGGIPKTDLASAVQTSLGKADSAYQKPSDGIPASDMAAAVQTSLGKADAAAPQSTTYTKNEVDTLLQNVDIDVDSALSTTSENPVQNKVVTAALAAKQNSLQLATINGSRIDQGGNVTIVAAEGQTITIDATPTQGSNNAVSSGGVYKDKISNELANKNAEPFFEFGTLDTYQGVGSTATLNARSSTTMKHLIVDVISGEKYKITATGSSYGYSYAVLDASKTILASKRNSVDVELTIPANGVKLVVQYNINSTFVFFKVTAINSQIDSNSSAIAALNDSVLNTIDGENHINKINPANLISSKGVANIAVGSTQTLTDSDNNDACILDSSVDITPGYYTFTGIPAYALTNSNDVVTTRRVSINVSDVVTVQVSSGNKLWLTIPKPYVDSRAIVVSGNSLPEEYIKYNQLKMSYQGEDVFEAGLVVPGENVKDKSISSEKYANDSIPITAIPSSTIQDLKWDNILWGKKLIVAGDSFTYGTGAGRIPTGGIYGGKGALQLANWARFVALRNNMTLVNEAIGGSTMAMPVAWINDQSATLDSDALLHIFSYKRYLNTNFDDADYIILNFGINDGAPEGLLDDTDATFLSDAYDGPDGVDITQVTHTDFNFYGAYNKVIRSILTRNPRAKIGLVIAERGIARIQNCIVKVAIRWGIPYIFQSGDPHISLIGVGNMTRSYYHGRLNTSYWYEIKFVNKEEYYDSSLAEWDSEAIYSNGDQIKYSYFDVATGKNEYVFLQSRIANNDKKPIVTMSDEAYDIRNRAFDSKYGTGAPDDPTAEGSPYHPNYPGQLYLSTVYESFLRSL